MQVNNLTIFLHLLKQKWHCFVLTAILFFHSKKPKKPQRRQMNNRLKPLTLAYDGDADM